MHQNSPVQESAIFSGFELAFQHYRRVNLNHDNTQNIQNMIEFLLQNSACKDVIFTAMGSNNTFFIKHHPNESITVINQSIGDQRLSITINASNGTPSFQFSMDF